jgi:hypothetical protein
MKSKYLLVGAFLLLLVLALTACSGAAPEVEDATAVDQAVEAVQEACPTAAPCPTCETCPPPPVVEVVPFEEEWANSPHNDAEAAAFTHWNEDDPQEIPANCATCHSTTGYSNFVSGAESVAVPVGETITCDACHSDAANALSEVTFPSGAVISNLGPEARCMVCHQGRASKVQVDESIAKFNLTEDVDTVAAPVGDPPSSLGFINIHYYPAGATLYGAQAMGGYEYDGKSYDIKNAHVEGYDSCVGCHDQHTLELKVEQCAMCHEGVASVEDIQKIRMASSVSDYDGDGDVSEPIRDEMAGLQEMLLTGIQSYAGEIAGAPIGYSPDAYPYFFNDTNADGQITEDEAVFPNAYATWTARLLKAAYNYQMSVKDPGAYAHGGKYIIQLMYDSIEDLNASEMTTKIDLTAANRIDAGHFAGSEEAFRHWDEDGMVEGGCAKCHSAEGLPQFLAVAAEQADGVSGANTQVHPSNGFMCSTCHDEANWPALYPVAKVKFPSGAVLSFNAPDAEENVNANVCLTCHQGRESTVSVDKAIASSKATSDDEVPLNAEGKPALRFRNPHYFAAGASLFGTEAQGMYQYAGAEYSGRFQHVQGFQVCTDCHDTHGLTLDTNACSACHGGTDPEAFRISTVDYDGDVDVTEGIAGEVATMNEKLLAAIQAYTVAQGLPAILYNPVAYPYFFEDTDGNGEVNGDEGSYTQWTPRLLRAAYNYQWSQKDPGGFAHNGVYVLQALYDSLQDVGGDVTGLTRPAIAAPAQ